VWAVNCWVQGGWSSGVVNSAPEGVSDGVAVRSDGESSADFLAVRETAVEGDSAGNRSVAMRKEQRAIVIAGKSAGNANISSRNRGVWAVGGGVGGWVSGNSGVVNSALYGVSGGVSVLSGGLEVATS